ncbi:MAD2L1-binding protein-like [Acropora palmata]|uniref:MAD2L1-binding protein-like n=1 Tax=Acropora palmata TaxID=6131 RepID=UPI003DA03638
MTKEIRVEVILSEEINQATNSRLLSSFIEYLLYQRQQLPLPVHELKRIVEEQGKNYDSLEDTRKHVVPSRPLSVGLKKASKVNQDLQCLFDHINQLFSVAEVNAALIILGSTAVSPKECYWLTFQSAKHDNVTDAPSRASNSACRKMIQTLISNQELGSLKDISLTSMLVFIQASRTSVVEWFRPKPTFKPPHRGRCCKITLRSLCKAQNIEDTTSHGIPYDQDYRDLLWFQAPIIIRGYRQRSGAF